MSTAQHPPARQVELADLAPDSAHAALLPPSARTLVRVAGAGSALVLLQRCPGVQFVVPLRADANAHGRRRWQQLADVVGDAAMPAIAAHYAPGVLDVPMCTALLNAKRNAWIRARFDALTAPHARPACSAYAALQEINLALAQAGWPFTLREVQKVVNAPPEETGATEAAAQALRQPLLPGIDDP